MKSSEVKVYICGLAGPPGGDWLLLWLGRRTIAVGQVPRARNGALRRAVRWGILRDSLRGVESARLAQADRIKYFYNTVYYTPSKERCSI